MGLSETVCDIHAVECIGVSVVSSHPTVLAAPQSNAYFLIVSSILIK
jgi:hypothetical protein